MRFQSIDDLDARIERIVRAKVRNYYSDWKNYDRPRYMACKGSEDPEDRDLVLIARTCGSYLLRMVDVKKPGSGQAAIFEYFSTQDRSECEFYRISIDRLAIEEMRI